MQCHRRKCFFTTGFMWFTLCFYFFYSTHLVNIKMSLLMLLLILYPSGVLSLCVRGFSFQVLQSMDLQDQLNCLIHRPQDSK